MSLLLRLGFVYKTGGQHNYKFVHPKRKPIDHTRQRPFIVLSTNTHPRYVKMIMKQIQQFGFEEEEIRNACKRKAA